MAQDSDETSYFRYCRRIDGTLEPVDVARRNGRLVPQFSPTVTEPYLLPEDEETPDYLELVEEVCQSLNDKERRRWLLAIREALSISEIAQMEAVSRQAIIDGFHRMGRRNPYVRIWLDHKNKINQHS